MKPINICIFGDSITWGAYLPFRIGWVNQIRDILERKNSQIAVYDLGIDRNTSKDLLTRFDTEASARKPDVVVFAIGINDSLYRNNPNNRETGESDFKLNLEKLVDKAKTFTDKVVFVGLVKGDDSKTTPLLRSTSGKFYDKQSAYKYNEIIKTVAQENNLGFVDILSKLDDTDFDDGLHPNVKGHSKISDEVITELSKGKYNLFT